MELDDLKSNWKNAGQNKKSPTDLQRMTRIENHPRLKRIRTKLLIEVVLLSVFLLVYQDIFDASDKPLWVNSCLIAGVGLFVLNDIVGYFMLRNLHGGSNLAQFIHSLRTKLKRLQVLSLSTSLFFGASLILFFSVGLDFTTRRYLLLAGMILSLFVLTYVSFKNWSYRINEIQKTAEEFTGSV